MVWERKYKSLVKYIECLESVAIAFSGGVDSTLLLKAAVDSNLKHILAFTVVTPYIPSCDIKRAEEIVNEFNINQIIINKGIIDSIIDNPENRCYLCKKYLFSAIIEEAKKKGIKNVIDGTNADDLKDYRPGIIALKELNIKSPFVDLGFNKNDIREISKNLNLNTWNKASNACYLSRIPYGEKINIDKIKRIEKSEEYILSLGFYSVRVRSHGDIARIEVPKEERKKLFNEELLDDISIKLKEFGYKYVSIDAQGYKEGSLNNLILRK